ncbi:MAG: hypothetical protein KJ749_06355 [Planctomycetes bacterium]|nr:hypothetical protein [Planctomycetota bacterium]
MSELRSLGSQAQGMMMAINREFSKHEISIQSGRMLSLTSQYDYGDDIDSICENVQVVLHQAVGYFRGLESDIY